MRAPTIKESCLLRYAKADVPTLVNRKLAIHKQLSHPVRPTVVYSDLHGSYDKFLHWMKNGMGYFRIAISEILGYSYAPKIFHLYEKLFLLANRSTIENIVTLAQNEKSAQKEDFFTQKIPQDFLSTLQELQQLGLSSKRILEDLLIFL
ncbi:MAG: hypothetical protein WCG27_08010, partial [Pseudomonadota bacterium]